MINIKDKWSSRDFKDVSERHYLTCKHLKSVIGSLSDENKKATMFDMYYLSGYVIECLLKYYYLSWNHHDGSYTLKQLGDLELKTHKLKDLLDKASENDGINIDFSNKSDLLKSWTEQIRYDSGLQLMENQLLDYFDNEITVLRTQILNSL